MTHYEVESIETSPLVTISPDATLQTALGAMFSNGVRQIGVENENSLAGVVTHQSITRAQLLLTDSDLSNGMMDRKVALAMEDPQPMIEESEDVFTLFDILADSPYVLVDRGNEYHVLRDVGFHQYLRSELEVFILIEEIERAIRRTFRNEFGDDLATELTAAFEDKELRTPSSVRDCSFVHYQIFISANWDRFEEHFSEDREFVRELLSNTGDIRNTLFHFRSTDQQKIEEGEYLMFVRDYFDSDIHSHTRAE